MNNNPPQATMEEVTTIFVVGFPEDMSEREFQGMFTFSSGFEGASLKFPQVGDEEISSNKKQIVLERLKLDRIRQVSDSDGSTGSGSCFGWSKSGCRKGIYPQSRDGQEEPSYSQALQHRVCQVSHAHQRPI
jgi:hypothetical protein